MVSCYREAEELVMNVAELIYLGGLLDDINCLIAIGLTMYLSIWFFCFLLHRLDGDFFYEFFKKVCKYWKIALISGILLIFLPSKNTMYLMFGASYLQQPSVPIKVQEVINLQLDEYIHELKGSVKQ